MKFADLEFSDNPRVGGKRTTAIFPNGYGASIVTGGSYSFTDTRHPYEVAVFDADSGELVYDTPITNDVLPRQTKGDVSRLLAEIEALPRKGE